MKPKTKINLIGWVGVFLILIAYAFLTFNILSHKSIYFNSMNLLGGLLLAYRVWVDKNYSNLFLEIVFIIIAFIAIIKNL